MIPDWVIYVWGRNKTANVQAASDDIYEKYKIPMFYKIGMTSSGLDIEIKSKLKKLVVQNGGLFYGAFKSEKITILIMHRDQITSQKFKAAVQCKTICLTPDWITDSIEKGYALPIDAYKLISNNSPKLSASTPSKGQTRIELLSNLHCTQLSEITLNSTINDSIRSNCYSNSNSGNILFSMNFQLN